MGKNNNDWISNLINSMTWGLAIVSFFRYAKELDRKFSQEISDTNESEAQHYYEVPADGERK